MARKENWIAESAEVLNDGELLKVNFKGSDGSWVSRTLPATEWYGTMFLKHYLEEEHRVNRWLNERLADKWDDKIANND